MDISQRIYSAHFKPLYKYFAYRDLSGPDCEDACQEVFLRFFQKYSAGPLSETGQSKILYTIARNVYLEQLRKLTKHAHNELFEDDLPEGHEWTQFVEEEQSPQGEDLRAELIQAIAQLSPALRQVLEMRFIEGLTRREIAEKLNTKEKYVHIYQQRAIKQLQKVVSLPAYTK